jgi:hypothetical protein
MKNKDYWGPGDPRYFKLWEKMEMLGIKDVSSPCQYKNGTVVWRLPIKNTYSRKGEFIEVASYEAGYVRVLNTCMSPYYINKPVFNHVSGNYSSKKPKLIPIEIERLEYLISYCLKNMYIKLANKPQTLLASNENLQSEADVFLSELFERDEEIESISIALSNRDELISKMDDEIIQLKQDIAVTEANTELFREVHLSAYNKMIKIKEIIGC